MRFKSGFIHPLQPVFFRNGEGIRYGKTASWFHGSPAEYRRVRILCPDPFFPGICQAHQRPVPETRSHLVHGTRFRFTVQVDKQRVRNAAPAEFSPFAENAPQGGPVQKRQVHIHHRPSRKVTGHICFPDIMAHPPAPFRRPFLLR